MSTKRLRRKIKKSAVSQAYTEMSATKKVMRQQAHGFVCHGFISEPEYKKVIKRISEYYDPLLNAFRKKMEKEKDGSS